MGFPYFASEYSVFVFREWVCILSRAFFHSTQPDFSHPQVSQPHKQPYERFFHSYLKVISNSSSLKSECNIVSHSVPLYQASSAYFLKGFFPSFVLKVRSKEHLPCLLPHSNPPHCLILSISTKFWHPRKSYLAEIQFVYSFSYSPQLQEMTSYHFHLI